MYFYVNSVTSIVWPLFPQYTFAHYSNEEPYVDRQVYLLFLTIP
jgi:hypothetical protein